MGIAGAVDGPGEWGVMGSVHICLLPDLLCVEGRWVGGGLPDGDGGVRGL